MKISDADWLEGEIQRFFPREDFQAAGPARPRRKQQDILYTRARHPDLTAVDLQRKVSEDRLRFAARRWKYRKLRAPRLFEKAGKLVFDHIPDKRSGLRGLINEAHAFFIEDLSSPSAGRDGARVVLCLIKKLVARLPLEDDEKSKLVEPIEFLLESFEIMRDGASVPQFSPARKLGGRPKLDRRQRAFRMRCVLAYDALLATGKGEEVAAREVYRRAKASADWLKMGRSKEGFSVRTIQNWHERNSSAFNAWAKSKSIHDDDTDPDIIERSCYENFARLFIRNRRELGEACSLANLPGDELAPTSIRYLEIRNPGERMVEAYLNSLALGNVCRSMPVIGGRSSL